MPVATNNAWLALHAGARVVVAVCAVLADLKTAHELQSGALVLGFRDPKDCVSACLKLWWRWQLNDLSGTLVMLVIAIIVAHHLGFATLTNV